MLEQKPRASAKPKSSKKNGAGAASAAPVTGPVFAPESVAKVKEERARWERETVAPATRRMPERPAETTTQSGMPINRIYTPEDAAGLDYGRDLGMPGEYPYTRGAQPTMYRAKPWTMRMFAGFGTAEETNERFHYLLEHGQTGLSVAFDMATLYGYD
ncbi:MAG: methylmalonyl-CoA mutase family protein, partial [Caulobacterales bacterium]